MFYKKKSLSVNNMFISTVSIKYYAKRKKAFLASFPGLTRTLGKNENILC